MNQTLFLSQLRVIILVGIAYAAGKGWLSPADSTAITSVLAPLGVIAGPWIWSIYSNFNAKLVPKDSVAVHVVDVNDANNPGLQRGVPVPVGSFIKLPEATKVVGALLLAIVLGALAFPGDALAQTPSHKLNLPIDPLNLNGTPVTGNVKTDIQALWQKIVASSLTDLNYAAAMAQSANTTTATVRLQCLKAIITLNEQASGANLKNPDGTPMAKPDPHMFTDVESLAEIVDNLSPQGPLFVNCAGAAQLAKTNVLSFVNAVVTGAAGFAAMPIIPGL